MPPSPALRRSPGRDLRVDNHKRGRSLEGGFLVREKDDDLVLFNEMQTRETDDFLLHSTDDLDDSLTTKLKSLSSFKLEVPVPVRGESSDLLNAEEEKNDYDWLLTPPDTPLFRSLDDETPPVNLVQRGRPRSQPISISRSTSTEKSTRTSRTSASPHRLSPSPRSGNSTFQSRAGRPSSAPHSSPPISRPSTPSRRPSTPPIKPSTPAQRSSTPTSRKVNIESSGTATSSGRRGTSPVSTSRGSSASPKFRAWQSNIPGFSSEAPPNLRTSLSDRPASYVRGTSPASRNGRDSSKFGRQSMSPTASRSANSPNSFDRDRFNSQSKGSLASSGDDDVDSLHSNALSISERSVTKNVGAFPNSRVAFSKQPSRTTPSISAPKRSFDSALRQMERKSPQNMFRPLLSSVPSSTFYVGNTNPAFRPMISRNSSVTTSSNASSEHGASGAPDTEGRDHGKDDMTIERDTVPCTDVHDEVFIFDKVDEINEDDGNEIYDREPDIEQLDVDRHSTCEVEPAESGKWSIVDTATALTTTVPEYNVEVDHSEVDCESTPTCSQCGRKFIVIEVMDKDKDICPDCFDIDACITMVTPETRTVFTNSASRSQIALEENKSYDESGAMSEVPELSETVTGSEPEPVQLRIKIEQGESCLQDGFLAGLMVEEREKNLVDQKMGNHPTVSSSQSPNDTADEIFKSSDPSIKRDVSEAAGISLLLRRSCSSKWPVVQGRPFTATNIPCDDPSYVRDGQNSMRNSIGHGSASTSSSVDWSSSRHTEVRVQRQSSGRKDDMGTSRHDLNITVLRRGSSFSGTSNHSYQASVHSKSTNIESFDGSIESEDYTALNGMPLVTEEQCVTSNNSELDYRDSSFIRKAVHEEKKLDSAESSRRVDDSSSEISSRVMGIQLEEIAIPTFPSDGDCVSSGNSEDLLHSERSISNVEVSVMTPESSFRDEHATMNSGVCGTDISGAQDHGSSVVVSTDVENGHANSHDSQSDSEDSRNSKSTVDEQEASVPRNREEVASVPVPNTALSDHGHGILEESNVTVEGRNIRRSLTLDEATDTILFCSSIVHDLAYKAATIALKENMIHVEGSRPMVTIPEKSSSDRKDQRGRTVRKRTTKSEKARQRQVETEVKTPSISPKTDITTNDSLTQDSGHPRKVDSVKPLKLESKCNCTVM